MINKTVEESSSLRSVSWSLHFCINSSTKFLKAVIFERKVYSIDIIALFYEESSVIDLDTSIFLIFCHSTTNSDF